MSDSTELPPLPTAPNEVPIQTASNTSSTSSRQPLGNGANVGAATADSDGQAGSLVAFVKKKKKKKKSCCSFFYAVEFSESIFFFFFFL
jgi:hypothetical protein